VPQNKRETLDKIVELEKGNLYIFNNFRKPQIKEGD